MADIETPAPRRFIREFDWNLLGTFVVLAESRSVTEAAHRLSLRQPSVSTALKRLEEQIGARLIDRAPGRFELTDAGKLLYTEAVEIQGSILRLGTLMRDVQDEVRGHITICMASHVVCLLFDTALQKFHKANPKATVTIEIKTSADAIAEVAGKRASLAVCLVRDRSPKLEYRRVYREFFGLFCGPAHPLFGRSGLTLADLAGQSSVSFVTDQMSDVLRPVTLMRAEANLTDTIVGTSAHLEEVRRMIVAGLGIGPLPVHVVRPDVEAGLLWQVPPYEEIPAIDVHMVWNPRAKLNRAESGLIRALLDEIEATPLAERTYR